MKYFDLSDFWAIIRGLRKDETKRFEDDFASYIGVKYAIGTSYGRTALYLGLKAIGAENSEILIPAFTCTVVRQAIAVAGAKPRFVDINYENFSFDLEDLEKNITEKAKVIILTHYFGRVAANVEQVIEIARDNGLTLVEDCAHSLGAKFKGKKIGTYGDFAIFSLTKNTINFGGGFLTTNNNLINKSVRQIIEKGKKNIIRRFVDLPLVITYGLEQFIDKTIFDRVGRSFFKWWLIHTPKSLLFIRLNLIKFIKLPLTIRKKDRPSKSDVKHAEAIHGHQNSLPMSYYQTTYMEPIIAALGRTQLRKIDTMIQQRRLIYEKQVNLQMVHFKKFENSDTEDVSTHVVLWFEKNDIFDIIDKCKKQGLLLRATWPTHQRLWSYQDTENVLKIKKHILTWNVSPMLDEKEVSKFIDIVKELEN